MGAVSGSMECLDFDSRDAFEAFGVLAVELIPDIWERLCAYGERTPNGQHLFWRCETIEGNLKLAHDATGKAVIETRGEGGFVIVGPSYGTVHPSGEPYVADGSMGDIPTLTPDERDAVLTLARSMDERPRKEAQEAHHISVSPGAGERPGDIYVARMQWGDVLVPHGWQFIRRLGSQSYWRRPSKNEGISATTKF